MTLEEYTRLITPERQRQQAEQDNWDHQTNQLLTNFPFVPAKGNDGKPGIRTIPMTDPMTPFELECATEILRQAAAAWFNDRQLTILERVLQEASKNVSRESSDRAGA